MTLEQLKEIAREYLDAKREYERGPCLHRYRGIVREREVARRRKRFLAAQDALYAAVG